MDFLDSKTDIQFLPKPNIDINQLGYLEKQKTKVYTNLYEIKLKSPLRLYQYPYKVNPEIEEGNLIVRKKIFNAIRGKIRDTYGEFFISGDSLYSKEKVDELHTFQSFIFYEGKRNCFSLHIQNAKNEKVINQNNIHIDPLAKQFIELIIKDILHSHPKLEFYKDIFYLTKKEEYLETDRVNVYFYPGFTTSFMETDSGNYLNVTIKNRIIKKDSIFDYLINNDYTNNKNHKKIRKELKGRSFKVSYMKKNYQINDILFDRNPMEQTINFDGKSINLYKYYLAHHGIKINDQKQPLILVKKKGPQGEENNLYFIPELCHLNGLEDNEIKDGFFMKLLAQKTKLEPNDRIMKTDQFLELLKETERKNPETEKKEPETEKKEPKTEKYNKKKNLKQ